MKTRTSSRETGPRSLDYATVSPGHEGIPEVEKKSRKVVKGAKPWRLAPGPGEGVPHNTGEGWRVKRWTLGLGSKLLRTVKTSDLINLKFFQVKCWPIDFPRRYPCAIGTDTVSESSGHLHTDF